jgi:hypothetical protein
MVSAKMNAEAGTRETIAWRKWSREAFDEARASGKLVLLDLSADWCHWCHVMDRTTYSDPEVVAIVNKDFVPLRVDIDARPDISERYNRGGFPTTAFLSDQGESVWGATYLPPADMRRVMAGILSAKASGEIADALERSRLLCLDVPRTPGNAEPVDDGVVDVLFEDIFATYDVEHGGFGLYPKFPHPDVLNLLLLRYLATGDEEVAGAARHTISRMRDGLYDEVEGGVFRYSVTRDWNEPHYEKMLETNAGFLKNLVGAHKAFGLSEYEEIASGVVGYILGRLRDPRSGGFYGSQDADETYYKLPAKMRARSRMPTVVQAVYGGWNSEAVAAVAEAGTEFGNRTWLDAAVRGWEHSLARLWDPGMGLLRHDEHESLYLFEDQVSFLDALMSMYSLTGSKDLLGLGGELVSGIERRFPHIDGGYADTLPDEDAVGELREKRRSLVANSRYARLLALYSTAAHDPQLAELPKNILMSFSRKELEAHGLFAAEFLISWHVLGEGAKVVSVSPGRVGDILSNKLWAAAKSVHNPAVICTSDADLPIDKAGAVICTSAGCSEVITSPSELVSRLRVRRASQV